MIAGTEITGLSFNVLDETDQLLDWNNEWFRPKNTGLIIDWEIQTKKNKNKYSKTKDNILPNIIIPNESQMMEYNIVASIKDDISLQESFQITVLPDIPVQYNILTSVNLPEGIMNNNHNDLKSKIQKIVLFDQYHNIVPVMGRDIMPELIVSWIQPEMNMNDNMDNSDNENDQNDNSMIIEENRTEVNENYEVSFLGKRKEIEEFEETSVIELIKKTKSKRRKDSNGSAISSVNESHNELLHENYQVLSLILTAERDGYIIAPNVSLNATRLPPFPIWFIVKSSINDPYPLESFTQPSLIIPGTASQLACSSLSLNIDEMKIKHDNIAISQFTELNDLRIYIIDNLGIEPTYTNVKNLQVEVFLQSVHNNNSNNNINSMETDDSNENEMITVKIPKHRFTSFSKMIFPPIIFHKYLCNNIYNTKLFNIVITGKYTLNGLDIELNPSIIQCNFININYINNIEFILNNKNNNQLIHKTTKLNENETIKLNCDEKFPNIQLQFDTDDNIPFLPKLDSITYRIDYNHNIKAWANDTSSNKFKPNTGIGNKKTIDMREQFELILNNNNENNSYYELLQIPKQIIVASSNSSSSNSDENNVMEFEELKSGLYTFTIEYKENRMSMSKLPENKKKIIKILKILLVNGKPCKIQLSNDTSKHFLWNSIASNSIGRTQRIIASNVALELIDKSGNICQFPEDYCIGCRIARSEKTIIQLDSTKNSDKNNTQVAMCPELEDQNPFGILYGNFKSNDERTKCIFDHLVLKPDIGGNQDGIINIIFHVEDMLNGRIDNKIINYLIMNFHFITNNTRHESIKGINDELNAIKNELSIHNSHINSYQNEIISIDNKIKDLLHDYNNKFRNLEQYKILFKSLNLLLTNDIIIDLNKDLKRLISQYNDMKRLQDNTQTRQPIIPSKPANNLLLGKNTIGLVVEIGYVDDEVDSRILSWAAANYLDAMVVEDSKTAKELYNSGVKSWAIDQINPFEIMEPRRDG